MRSAHFVPLPTESRSEASSPVTGHGSLVCAQPQHQRHLGLLEPRRRQRRLENALPGRRRRLANGRSVVRVCDELRRPFAAGEQGALQRVEQAEARGLGVFGEVVAEQKVVDEGLGPLASHEGRHDGVEPGAVLDVEEEVHLVAGVLGVQAAALRLVRGVPPAKPRELAQHAAIPAQRGHEPQRLVHCAVLLRLRVRRCRERCVFARLQRDHGLGLHEVLGRVQGLLQRQVAVAAAQRRGAGRVQRLARVAGHHRRRRGTGESVGKHHQHRRPRRAQVGADIALSGEQGVHRQRNEAVRPGSQVGEGDSGAGEHVEAGLAVRRAGSAAAATTTTSTTATAHAGSCHGALASPAPARLHVCNVPGLEGLAVAGRLLVGGGRPLCPRRVQEAGPRERVPREHRGSLACEDVGVLLAKPGRPQVGALGPRGADLERPLQGVKAHCAQILAERVQLAVVAKVAHEDVHAAASGLGVRTHSAGCANGEALVRDVHRDDAGGGHARKGDEAARVGQQLEAGRALVCNASGSGSSRSSSRDSASGGCHGNGEALQVTGDEGFARANEERVPAGREPRSHQRGLGSVESEALSGDVVADHEAGQARGAAQRGGLGAARGLRHAEKAGAPDPGFPRGEGVWKDYLLCLALDGPRARWDCVRPLRPDREGRAKDGRVAGTDADARHVGQDAQGDAAVLACRHLLGEGPACEGVGDRHGQGGVLHRLAGLAEHVDAVSVHGLAQEDVGGAGGGLDAVHGDGV
mmetsp:Transcript_2678/g.10681  ORF Transcript_2678/g.10681 Transcript_2678/m.10681 type:complete len:751 (+) Transcript_2678:312-2564(+)